MSHPPADAASHAPAGGDAAPSTRVALCGAGFIASYHAEILRALPGVAVVAVVDPDGRRAQALARSLPDARVGASIDELDAAAVDLVHVLTPPDRHAAQARELLERGMGVYLEKPAALEARGVRELADLARRLGLPFGVNHNHVHHPAFARLFERIQSGEIGTVDHVQVTWNVPLGQLEAREYSSWMLRAPRNVVFEQGVHPLSQVHALVGPVQEARTTVLGTRELAPGQLFHDRWLVAARGERGSAEIYLGFSHGFPRNTIQVIGSDGTLEADFAHDSLVAETSTHWADAVDHLVSGLRKRKSHGSDALRAFGDYVGSTLGLAPRRDGWYAGMRASIRGFHEALASGRAVPTDGETAAEVIEWCEAVTCDVEAREAPAIQVRDAGEPRPGELCVFGATGFIGRALVRELLERRLPVTVVVRDERRLPPDLGAAAARGELRVVRGGIEDGVAIGKGIFGAERVLHLASGGGSTWKEVQASVVQGTQTIAHACLRNDVKRLVYVSSVAALYTGDDVEGELADSTATDRMPEARATYARGKIACEHELYALHRDRGLHAVVARPGVVVGEGAPLQHSGLGYWPRENHCIGWGRGEHPLPLVLVEDVVDALVELALLDSDELDGQALNLCARPPVSARQMVEALRDATGRALHFHGRPLESSFAMEIGKWAVKGVGRRALNEFPSWRDLKSRALRPSFAANLAREVLGWRPIEERDAFMERAVWVHARPVGARS